MAPLRISALALLAAVCHGVKEDERDCEVCKQVIDTIDKTITAEDRKDLEKIESKMFKWCAEAKGKDKTMCYYIGVGDKESGTAGGVKRDISGALSRGINAKRLCTRMKKKDAQMCELRYEKKIDVKNTDLKKLRVKELRKIADDEGIDVKGLVEKDEFIKKINSHFGIKAEL
mmetsp:Transcript_8161/g.16392  ORF Transcript_8161/g.16392 Transcript_8161/m.16392 type:complete len:173 (-) Transcript_8161:125-643(-)|eukprot:CAMPEP_0119056784 /NCGR_PEP_ID=MMETSP1178-20130426/1353_1 /TAXON_ID=33656 /ORGANISM="unid sp, Strain CCMP2000" /LENGTH=172 /DNA_ID=CAMNT_0007037547 /DNA_START=37 /DNA_END=555 /DNA_ORIENTATION=-